LVTKHGNGNDSFPQSPDPIEGNPFPPGHPGYDAWEKATRQAEQELYQVNALFLELLRKTPFEARRKRIDAYACLFAAKFDVWAKRNVLFLWNDAGVRAFDQWLADYANAWLNMIKERLPSDLEPGRETDQLVEAVWLLQMERIQFWKSEARRYLGEQEEHREAAGKQAPRGKKHTKNKPGKSKQRPLQYRSELKQAILMVLSQHPDADNLQVCRYLDDEGRVEVPAKWRTGGDQRNPFRSFELVLQGPDRHKIEAAITKVRNDMRKCGLLKASL
jgi:hypothetical protein